MSLGLPLAEGPFCSEKILIARRGSFLGYSRVGGKVQVAFASLRFWGAALRALLLQQEAVTAAGLFPPSDPTPSHSFLPTSSIVVAAFPEPGRIAFPADMLQWQGRAFAKHQSSTAGASSASSASSALLLG